ncbi:MAG: hypothetical protein V4569_08070 [Pseudomonadota bacterium]
MPTLFKAGLAAVTTAAALLAAPVIATAADAPLNATGTQSQLASSLLAQTVAHTVAQAPESSSLFAADLDNPQGAPSATALRAVPLGNLSGGSELLLWNLIAMVRAHQVHHSFELVTAGINTVLISEDIGNVSAVPLPGAVWLFVMGVMGLAGTRITGVGKGAGEAKVKRDATPGFGAVVTG